MVLHFRPTADRPSADADLRRPPTAPDAPALRRKRRRRRAVAFLTAGVLLVTGSVAYRIREAGSACGSPVAQRAVQRLAVFESWLKSNNAKGYVGEVGWPDNADAQDWNAVAQAWYTSADQAGLWVTAWAASQWWPSSYTMANYRFAGSATGTVSAGRQASVLEAHTDPKDGLRGIDLPSGAFATADEGNSTYSNADPGVYRQDYRYENYAQYRYLALHGYQLVRLSVSWERLQPKLDQPLDATEVSRLTQSIRAASQAGLSVIIDLHNFGGYWEADGTGGAQRLTLGSEQLPDATFADFWQRFATRFSGVPGIAGYGLMNEPRKLAPTPRAGARLWESASNAAVRAIRATGDRRLVLVQAYGAAAPEQFASLDPRAWIDDPLGLTRYEMHEYFDTDGSGAYKDSFSAEAHVVASLDHC